MKPISKRNTNTKLKWVLSLSFCFLFACAPASRTSAPTPKQPKEDIIFQSPAQPTYTTPDSNSYVTPPTQLKTKDNKVVIVGATQVLEAHVQYNSIEKKLIVSGEALILDEQKQTLAQKKFSLIGYHKENENVFSLYDVNDNLDKSLLVRGQNTCIGVDEDGVIDCSHIIIDLYLNYKNTLYTEQLEAYNKIQDPSEHNNSPEPSPATQLPAPNTPTPVDPAQPQQPQQPSTPVAPPTPPQSGDLQSEGEDDSLNGRYQGTIDTVDLDKLFATPAPTIPPEQTPTPAPAKPPVAPKAPTKPPVNPPAAPPAPVAPAKPPTQPTPPPAPVAPAKPPTNPQLPTPQQPAPPQTPDPVVTPANPTQPNPDLPPKIISDDLLQLPTGGLRPYNQSIGFPNSGKLRNATSILEVQKTGNNSELFEVVAPQREKHYGTYEMSQAIIASAKYFKEKYNRRLFVANTSLKNGGVSRPHKSHQNGIDVDIAYPSIAANVKFPVVATMKPRRFYSQNYSTEKTFYLFKNLFSNNQIKVDRIFIDDFIKNDLCAYAKKQGETIGPDRELVKQMFENLQHIDGHGDHFHIRIKCSQVDSACRSRVYRRMQSCR